MKLNTNYSVGWDDSEKDKNFEKKYPKLPSWVITKEKEDTLKEKSNKDVVSKVEPKKDVVSKVEPKKDIVKINESSKKDTLIKKPESNIKDNKADTLNNNSVKPHHKIHNPKSEDKKNFLNKDHSKDNEQPKKLNDNEPRSKKLESHDNFINNNKNNSNRQQSRENKRKEYQPMEKNIDDSNNSEHADFVDPLRNKKV